MKIILDTNFLVYCAKQKIDYKERIRFLVRGKYDLVVPSQVVMELRKLEAKAKKYSDKQAANLSLQLLKFNDVKTIKTQGNDADEGIVNINKGNYVATTDRELKDRVERTIVIMDKTGVRFG